MNTFIVGLRPVDVNDLTFLIEWRNKPEYMVNFRQSEPITLAAQLKWFQQLRPEDKHFIMTDGIRSLGYCSLNHVSLTHKTAEFSIFTVPGVNVGYFALKQLIRKGFEEMGLNKIYSDVLLYNTKALKLYLLLGFKTEGINREAYFKNGKFVDSIHIGLLRSEWEDRRAVQTDEKESVTA